MRSSILRGGGACAAALLFVLVGATQATEAPIDVVVAACVERMEMSLSQCQCAGQRLERELDDRLLTYLGVRIQEDWPEVERMRRDLVTFEERVQVVISMTRAVSICSDGRVTEIPL